MLCGSTLLHNQRADYTFYAEPSLTCSFSQMTIKKTRAKNKKQRSSGEIKCITELNTYRKQCIMSHNSKKWLNLNSKHFNWITASDHAGPSEIWIWLWIRLRYTKLLYSFDMLQLLSVPSFLTLLWISSLTVGSALFFLFTSSSSTRGLMVIPWKDEKTELQWINPRKYSIQGPAFCLHLYKDSE